VRKRWPTMPRRKTGTQWSAVWRVRPMPSLEYAVSSAASRANVTVPAMIQTLVAEALKARVAAIDLAPASETAPH
jgi:hypothetical protein